MEGRIDAGEIFRWFSIFRPTGRLAEIRVIRGRESFSGYFHNPQALLDALAQYPDLQYGNIYQIFNCIKEGCSSRPQYNHFERGATTTSDSDIEVRDWVFIDIDSRKPAGTNATDEEVAYATRNVTNRVYKFLVDQGFYPPVVIFSGNGGHIYIRCQLQNSPENRDLLMNFIKALGVMFNDERVEIDPKIFNAARMAKLPGTMSGKGRPNDTERPQRMCHFASVPEQIIPNDRAYFEKIAAMLPEQPKPDRSNNWGRESFDLQDFMHRHNIEVFKTVQAPDGTRYLLKNCIFDENHRNGEAMIFQATNGALAYYCFHASCAMYKWRDVRLHFEPDAYDRREYDDFQYRRTIAGKPTVPFMFQQETKEKGKKWLCTSDIATIDARKFPKVGTGIRALDKAIYGGLIFGQVTVISGRPGAGKSTLLNEIALNIVQQGVNTAIWSGELADGLLKSWIHQTAAGKNHIIRGGSDGDIFYITEETDKKIGEWLNEKLFIYNRKYGNKWNQLLSDIRDIVREKGVKVIILDNLMALDIDIESDKYESQRSFIVQIHDLAEEMGIHIILVAHPRKQTAFLRVTDISGTSDIGNLADNIFLFHRVNQDFENQGKAFFSAKKIVDMLQYSNVIEIGKNRIPGTRVGDLIGLFYEPESKRMKNSIAEMVQYGWDDTPIPSPIMVDSGRPVNFYNEPEEREYGIDTF